MDVPPGTSTATSEVPASEGTSPPPGLSVQEAAAALGVSPNTVRRWVKQGTLRSELVARPQGYSVRVYLPDRASPSATSREVPAWAPDHARAEAMASYSRALIEPLVAELAQAREHLAGMSEHAGRQAERIRQLEAELEGARGRIRALEPPKMAPATSTCEATPEPVMGPIRRPRWAFWRRAIAKRLDQPNVPPWSRNR
jgi:excisionase family DNA binding protein